MIRITIVNHVSIDIARPPAMLWQEILSGIAQGGQFAAVGCIVEPLTADPLAILGGCHIIMGSGDDADGATSYVTERDEQAMRLSVQAEFFGPNARGMVSHATYLAVTDGNSSRFCVDTHSTVDLPVGKAPSREEVAKAAAALRDEFQRGMQASLNATKARLER
jgi:hypothetical protein